jgi:hypothetical protein
VREISSNLYDLKSYYLIKNLVDIPILFIAPLLQLLIVYWAVGYQPGAERFWMMYTFLLFVCICGAGVGFMIGSIADRINES